jgi:hypothetical protein
MPELPEGPPSRADLASLASSQPSGPGRRLSFSEQCAVFHCLKATVKPSVVARAFGVTATTLSLLKNCEGTNRYPNVWNTYNKLGADEFHRRYYTDEIHQRVKHALYEIEEEINNRERTGPNRSATKFSCVDGASAFRCGDSWWRIDWVRQPEGPNGPAAKDGAPGWYVIDCNPDGSRVDSQYELPYRGREMLDGSGTMPATPFRTSKLAYDAVFKLING